MSLDVTLVVNDADHRCKCLECGNEHASSEGRVVYARNITHNLTAMAKEAGIYEHLWRPDEISITKAGQLIEPLRAGFALMQSDPDRFKAHNPANGWGSYESLIIFINGYLVACIANPEAKIYLCR